MDARVKDVRYRMGFQPVTIIVATPFGETRIQTTQATLGGDWGDTEVIALAQTTLDTLYPTAHLTVVSPE